MAGAQPPPTPTTSVHELPDDLVLSILRRVPCKKDRVQTSLVCKAWRNKFGPLIKSKSKSKSEGEDPPPPPPPLPPPLPWLLLPSRKPDGPSRVVCVLSDCHGHDYLTINPPGERFVGSYDGAWIFLYSDKTRTHRLFNARTRQVRILPEELVVEREGHETVHSMVMLAATLSSSPDDSQCVGATILARERDRAPGEGQQQLINRWIAFWRMGWEVAYQMTPGVDMAADLAMYHAGDVVYHDRAFHFLLTCCGAYQTVVCTAGANPEDPLTLEINWEVRRFRPPGGRRIYGHGHQHAFVRALYLVVSRGELLMVVRFATGANQEESKFKVYRATKRPHTTPDDADFPVAEYPWAWSDLDTLDGRILFVGYGCSRSYEADQYPGFRPAIYFLDDGMFYEALLFGYANIRPYPCRDNGMWSEGRIRDCFPPPNSSDHSPPVWLLP